MDQQVIQPLGKLIPEYKQTKELTEYVELTKTHNQINAIQRQKDSMMEVLRNISGNFDQIIEQLKDQNVTEKEIAKFTEEEINKLFTDENGEVTQLSTTFETAAQELQFKRDYLSMLVENAARFDEIDKALEEMKKSTDDYNEEVRQLHLKTNGDVIEMVRNELANAVANDAEQAYIDGVTDLIRTIDDAHILEDIYNYYKEQGVDKLASDFFRRQDEVYDRFVKNCKRNELVVNFKSFVDLEYRALDEKYHDLSGLFAFAVVRWYSYKKTFNRLESVWLVQHNANLNLFMQYHTRPIELTEQQVEKLNNLKAGISKVLDLVLER